MKVNMSISLDKPVHIALDELREILETLAQDNLPENVSMPVQYSRSTVIQMCVVAYCEKHGVEVKWEEGKEEP